MLWFALETLIWSFSNSNGFDTFFFFCIKKCHWLQLSKQRLVAFLKPETFHAWKQRLIWPNSYYKNTLALKLFVGRVSAYFQIHMFSLTKSPDISEICWRPPTPHTTARGRSRWFIYFFLTLSIMLARLSLCVYVTTWEGSSHSFADGLKGPHVFQTSCGLVNTFQWFTADRRSAEADTGLWRVRREGRGSRQGWDNGVSFIVSLYCNTIC